MPTAFEQGPDGNESRDRLSDKRREQNGPDPKDPGRAAGPPVLEELARLAMRDENESADFPSDGDAPDVEEMSQELVFVDAGVDDHDRLLLDLFGDDKEGRRQIEVIVLSEEADGLTQITAALAGREGLDAVHLIAHGEGGSVQIDTALNAHRSLVVIEMLLHDLRAFRMGMRA